jgi:hypothetical protein
MSLKTITPNNLDLRQITILVPYSVTTDGFATKPTGGPVHGQWLELDRLLVQLWDSRSIRPKVVWTKQRGVEAKYCVERLLPGIMKRGMVDLVQ